jgi:hypothetical protein
MPVVSVSQTISRMAAALAGWGEFEKGLRMGTASPLNLICGLPEHLSV